MVSNKTGTIYVNTECTEIIEVLKEKRCQTWIPFLEKILQKWKQNKDFYF